MSRADELVNALFDFAVAHPEGFTNEQFMEAEDFTDLTTFNQTSRRLRAALSGDSITLVCDPPEEGGGRWTYRLVGQVDDGSPWIQNRLRDAETRVSTMSSVASALVNGTDGRTMDGRRARVIHKALSRLTEDLSDLAAESV